MKIVILYSGGLDSFLLYHYAKVYYPDAEVKCLFFAHGQDAEQAELDSLPDFVTVRQIDWLGDEIKPIAKKSDPYAGAIYIPGRNLVFSVLAASQEIADEVWMGTVWDEDNPKGTDKNEYFRSNTSTLLTYVLSPFIHEVTVRFPFVEEEWTKEDCIEWALENGLTSEEIISSSVSCWHPINGKACGECKQCTKRMLSFELNGFEEEYVVHPTKSPRQQENMLQYLKDFVDPDKRRQQNRDEQNVVDMLIRYFENRPLLTEWDIEMTHLINQVKI
jgi:7-cyano-7-deazaguanine synthase in queuosine biosynthesis